MKKIKHSNPYFLASVLLGHSCLTWVLPSRPAPARLCRERRDVEKEAGSRTGKRRCGLSVGGGRVPWLTSFLTLGGLILMCPSGSHLGSPTHSWIHPRFPRTLLLNMASCINQLGVMQCKHLKTWLLHFLMPTTVERELWPLLDPIYFVPPCLACLLFCSPTQPIPISRPTNPGLHTRLPFFFLVCWAWCCLPMCSS